MKRSTRDKVINKYINFPKSRGIISLLFIALCIGFALIYYSAYSQTIINNSIVTNKNLLVRTNSQILQMKKQVEQSALQQALAVYRIANRKNYALSEDYYQLQKTSDNLTNLQSANEYIHSAYVFLNQDNIIVSSELGVTNYNLFYDTSWKPYYDSNANKEIWIGPRQPSNDSKYVPYSIADKSYYSGEDEIISFILPLSESMSNRGGAVIINVYANIVTNLLANNGDYGVCLISTHDGEVVISSDKNTSALPAGLIDGITSGGLTGGDFRFRDDNGQENICVYQPFDEGQLVLLSFFTTDQILQNGRTLTKNIIFISLVLFVLFVIVLIMVSLISTRPIRFIQKNLQNYDDSVKNAHDVPNVVQKIISENSNLKKIWEANKSLIKQRSLSQIVTGNISDSDLENSLLYADIRFPHSCFVCVIMNINFKNPENIDPDQREWIKIRLFRLIQNCLTDPYSGYTVDVGTFNIAIIVNLDTDSPISDVSALCETIQNIVKNSVSEDLETTFAIGNDVYDIQSISSSYKNASAAMRSVLNRFSGEIVSINDVLLFREAQSSLVKNFDVMCENIRFGNIDDVIDEVDKWFNDPQVKEQSPFLTKCAAQELVRILGNEISTQSGSPLDFSMNYKQMSGLSSYDDIKKFTIGYLNEIKTLIANKRLNKNRQLIDSVQDYIQTHYMNEISLADIANNVYISVPYLCKIFKEDMGTTVNDYLTRVRIESSQKLLEDYSLTVSAVARRVGYSNTQSFIRAYKKLVGMTPSEHRAAVKNNGQ